MSISTTPTEWVSFEDAMRHMEFDLTFLTSNGHVSSAAAALVSKTRPPELQQGSAFRSQVQIATTNHRVRKACGASPTPTGSPQRAEKLGGPIYTNSGCETVTRVPKERASFSTDPLPGWTGCALHRGPRGRERRWTGSPGCAGSYAASQSSGDDEGQTTYTLREWKRPDWGGGGEEFHWWCTDDPMAFRDREKVYTTLKDEIIEMVGPDAYEFVVGHIERSTTTVMLPHPALRRKRA